MTPAQKRRLFRGVDPRPMRLERCLNFTCKCFIPPWQAFCWRHRVELAQGWPEV